MKKMLLLTFILLFALSSIVCAHPSDSEVVASFKQYVSGEVTKAISTYGTDNYHVNKYATTTVSSTGSVNSITWCKTITEINPKYTIDVQKNNSLVSPYIGTMEISKTVRFYDECSTKEEAEKSNVIRISDTCIYSFTLAYQNDNWVVTKVGFNHNSFAKTMSIYDTLKCKQR